MTRGSVLGLVAVVIVVAMTGYGLYHLVSYDTIGHVGAGGKRSLRFEGKVPEVKVERSPYFGSYTYYCKGGFRSIAHLRENLFYIEVASSCSSVHMMAATDDGRMYVAREVIFPFISRCIYLVEVSRVDVEKTERGFDLSIFYRKNWKAVIASSISLFILGAMVVRKIWKVSNLSKNLVKAMVVRRWVRILIKGKKD